MGKAKAKHSARWPRPGLYEIIAAFGLTRRQAEVVHVLKYESAYIYRTAGGKFVLSGAERRAISPATLDVLMEKGIILPALYDLAPTVKKADLKSEGIGQRAGSPAPFRWRF